MYRAILFNSFWLHFCIYCYRDVTMWRLCFYVSGLSQKYIFNKNPQGVLEVPNASFFLCQAKKMKRDLGLFQNEYSTKKQ